MNLCFVVLFLALFPLTSAVAEVAAPAQPVGNAAEREVSVEAPPHVEPTKGKKHKKRHHRRRHAKGHGKKGKRVPASASSIP